MWGLESLPSQHHTSSHPALSPIMPLMSYLRPFQISCSSVSLQTLHRLHSLPGNSAAQGHHMPQISVFRPRHRLLVYKLPCFLFIFILSPKRTNLFLVLVQSLPSSCPLLVLKLFLGALINSSTLVLLHYITLCKYYIIDNCQLKFSQ